jgi:hypothetical protein
MQHLRRPAVRAERGRAYGGEGASGDKVAAQRCEAVLETDLFEWKVSSQKAFLGVE